MSAPEQAVVVRADISAVDHDAVFEALTALEDRLVCAIQNSGVGEFDGNEVGQGDLVLYMYGPSADVVVPQLRGGDLLQRFPDQHYVAVP